MCGIFGVVAHENSGLESRSYDQLIKKLFHLSETRGKESAGAGYLVFGKKAAWVCKENIPATQFIKSKHFQDSESRLKAEAFEAGKAANTFVVMAHSRLVTNGAGEVHQNNQPVEKHGSMLTHNGIMTNCDTVWEREEFKSQKRSDLDTEALLELLNYHLEQKNELNQALAATYSELEGAASVAYASPRTDVFFLSTNSGSLYYALADGGKLLVYASEEFILKTLLNEVSLDGLNENHVKWLKPGTHLSVNLESFQIDLLEKKDATAVPLAMRKDGEVLDLSNIKDEKKVEAPALSTSEESRLRGLLEFDTDSVKQLKRCSKTILPENFPFITFDENGVSNYANNHKQIYTHDREQEFRDILDRYRRSDGKPDCIVPFSGGRDSSYGLHLLKTKYGMNPITFTYDWGMVTDLARRNIARMCGELGVENILVSADIKKKRQYIHQNVSAWLKNPDLGMIPLFMAGDKQFFKILNQIKKQTGLDLNLWFGNRLESTHFKSGFAGIPPQFDKERIYSLSLMNKFKLPMYYLKNFMQTPSYFNSSMRDTIEAFMSYYFEPRSDYFLPFDYIKWDEHEIDDVLINQYNWEISTDTDSTWRIGDGTAAFYNYVYYTVVGFTENDTFRSNQIMEGMIDREEAMKMAYHNNQPRYESIRWYLDTIGLDFETTIKTINSIPKKYPVIR